MSVQWNEDLATGVDTIDNQHKEIFRRINTLLDACKSGKGRDALGETIRFLQDYVVTHFTAEEALQRQSAYPEYDAHKALHEEFLISFDALKQEFDKEGATLGMVLQTNRVVVNWLVHHIGKWDKALAEHIRKNS